MPAPKSTGWKLWSWVAGLFTVGKDLSIHENDVSCRQEFWQVPHWKQSVARGTWHLTQAGDEADKAVFQHFMAIPLLKAENLRRELDDMLWIWGGESLRRKKYQNLFVVSYTAFCIPRYWWWNRKEHHPRRWPPLSVKGLRDQAGAAPVAEQSPFFDPGNRAAALSSSWFLQ